MQTIIKLTERQAAAAELEAVLADLERGLGGVVLIAGEAGIGKTALAEDGLTQSGVRFFTGRCIEDASPAFHPLVAVLRAGLRTAHGAPRQSAIPLLPYLGLLLPELGLAPPGADRDMLHEAIAAALAAMADEAPTAILLDDLHWADSATLEALPLLADRLQTKPLLIVGTYRSDEIPRGHRLRWLRNELRRRRQWREIKLEPLSPEGTAALLADILNAEPDAALAELIHNRTQGLPLFINELIQTLDDEGRLKRGAGCVVLQGGLDVPIPQSISDAIALRMERLSPLARQLLEAAAVAGMEFDLALLEALGESPGAIDELMEHNLLIGVGDGASRVAFRHALTRDSVRAAMAWSRRRELNRGIAEALERQDAPPDIVAEHWIEAHEPVRARAALLKAAEQACKVYAYWDAASTGRRALKLWPPDEAPAERLDALERLAQCAQTSGQLGEALSAWDEALLSPELQKIPARLGHAHRSRATILELLAKPQPALDARQAAYNAFLMGGLIADAAIESLSISFVYLGAGRNSDFLEVIREGVELAGRAKRIDLQARAMGFEAYAMALSGRFDEAHVRMKEALALAHKHNLPEVAAELYRRVGNLYELAAEYPEASRAFEHSIKKNQQDGYQSWVQDCVGCYSWAVFRSGDWKRAVELCRSLIADEDAPEFSRRIGAFTLTIIHALRGEAKQARRYARGAREWCQQNNYIVYLFMIEWVLAMLAEQDNDDAQAEAHYRAFLDMWEQTDDIHDASNGLMAAATFFAQRRRQPEAARCVAGLGRITAQNTSAEAMAGLACAMGEMALLKNNPAEAVRQFAQAVAQLEQLTSPWELARAEWRCGVACCAAGDNSEAIRHLTNAYRLAKNLGARPLASQAAASLESLGESPEEHSVAASPARARRATLTRRQLEVLRQVADGLTDKEIASKLHLSPRTVEMHVAGMLDRLDCRTRSEAVRKAGEMELI